MKQTLADQAGVDIITLFANEEIAMSEMLELTTMEGLLVAGGTDYTAPIAPAATLPNTAIVPMLGTGTVIGPGATLPNPTSR